MKDIHAVLKLDIVSEMIKPVHISKNQLVQSVYLGDAEDALRSTQRSFLLKAEKVTKPRTIEDIPTTLLTDTQAVESCSQSHHKKSLVLIRQVSCLVKSDPASLA
jgi:hypothetical protein